MLPAEIKHYLLEYEALRNMDRSFTVTEYFNAFLGVKNPLGLTAKQLERAYTAWQGERSYADACRMAALMKTLHKHRVAVFKAKTLSIKTPEFTEVGDDGIMVLNVKGSTAEFNYGRTKASAVSKKDGMHITIKGMTFTVNSIKDCRMFCQIVRFLGVN